MHSILLNIILQIIEALISFSFFESICKIEKKHKNLVAIVIGYMIMCVFNIVFNYNFIVNLLLLVLFQFLFSRFLYKQTSLFSLLYAILITCLVLIAELSVSNIIAFISNGETRDFIEDTYKYVLLIVFSKSLLFVILKIISEIINRFMSNRKLNFIVLIYPVSLLLILADFLFVSCYSSPTDEALLLLSVSSLILIFAVIATCILQQKQSQREDELIELKAFQQEQELNTTYFELLEHQNDELQVFIHDTKKHYRNLYDLSDDPKQLKEYIQGIVNDIEETNQIGKTRNKLLDLIISKYDYICEKKEIDFDKNIHQSDLSFIEDRDLTSIFNNLFDNAIDAVTKSKNKTISFGLNKVGNMVVIDVTNSCDNPPIVKSNKLITTKKDIGLHGYGFKSICRAVKKYNGDIEWEYKPDSKEFIVSIILPIEKHVEQ